MSELLGGRTGGLAMGMGMRLGRYPITSPSGKITYSLLFSYLLSLLRNTNSRPRLSHICSTPNDLAKTTREGGKQ